MVKVDSVNEMRKAGNAAMAAKDYEKAINIYSDALLISDIRDEDKGVLHSNRSHAYLMSAGERSDGDVKLVLALQDANDVIKMRPNWWKGYYRAGEVYKFKKEWNLAIDSFDAALALNPKLVDVKNCRDECRIDKMQDMKGNTRPHGFKEEIDRLNRAHGSKYDAADIVKDYEKLMKSKNPKSRARACVFFGVRYVKGIDIAQDIAKGVQLIREAVDAGSPEAMVELGILQMEGKVVERNIKNAVSLFEKAAQCESDYKSRLGGEHDGVAHAQFHIGLCFESGVGKPLDYYQARCWYEKASEGGHAGAANNIAILYEKGCGGEKCSERAKQFFSLSASRGNSIAMESLAWKHLEEKDVDEAEKWYARALDAENAYSMENKEKFDQRLAMTRNYLKAGADIQSELTGSQPAEMANLVAAIDRVTNNKPSIAKVLPIAQSPFAKYWADFVEIERRAKNGYPFARTLLMSMGYFAEGATHLNNLFDQKVPSSDIAATQEQCIHNLANCFRETEIIACFVPSELPALMRICKAKISKRKSDLNLAARVVYCFLLTVTQNSECFSFARMCSQLYPDEAFFYKMHAGAYAVRRNFAESMKVLDQGLQKFPTNECLLYCRAGAMKMIESCGSERVIAAYQEFIRHAPFDERMVPEAYYNIAFYASDELKETYYRKGQEAEREMLPCLLPYESNMKSLLDAMMIFKRKDENKRPSEQTAKRAEQITKTTSEASTKLQLTNPARLQFVQRHRQTFKNTTELLHTNNFVARMSLAASQNTQTKPKRPVDCTEITIRDMNPHKDEVYKLRFINLLISEDPMFGLYTAIHVIVRDDNGDCVNCSFYDLDHYDVDVRRKLCFGSKITVLNPYYRLASDGSVALRVDDPKSIIYVASGKDNPICRYCWKESPQHSCGNCKRAKYCCRSCQTDDWKILKHKLICGLKYFDDM